MEDGGAKEKLEKMDWELRKLQFETKQLMTKPEDRYEHLLIASTNTVYLFEKHFHFFKLECSGYLGPITFNCWKTKNVYVEFKAYLSMKHPLPNAKNCMKAVACSSNQSKKESDSSKPFFKFSFAHPDQRPFSDEEVLYISF